MVSGRICLALTSVVGLLTALLVTPSSAGASTAGPAVTLSQPTFDVGSTYIPDAYDTGPDVLYWAVQYTFHWQVQAPAGVCREELHRYNYNDEGSPYEVIPVDKTARSYATDMDQLTYFRQGDRLQVVVIDCSGGVAYSAWVHVQVDPHDEQALQFAGAWSVSTCKCAAYGTTHWTTQKNASVTFRSDAGLDSSGVDVALVMSRGPNRGLAAVYVDGIYWATINTYSSTAISSTFAYQVLLPGSKTHTIKVVNLATTGHARIDIDVVLNGA